MTTLARSGVSTKSKSDPYETLLKRCRQLSAVTTAVAYPCEATALAGAIEAAEAGLITPILVGPRTIIEKIAAKEELDITPYPIEEAADAHTAAIKAVELVRAAKAEVLMKGSLHTDELLSAVVPSATGLRTGLRISHAFVMALPTYPKPIIVTDGAINIAPTLEEKRDIIQNAINLAISLGRINPKVAILSAVETVTTKIPSTIDAAALCKMAERGQIIGGILEGPLAMDNAISKEAARTKGIHSPVAGDADILVAPDLEAGNILAKLLTFLANADAAGIVLGARVPIILTSRADSVRARMASCAVALLVAHARTPDGETRPLRERGGVVSQAIAVLNAGSSSLKFSLHEVVEGNLRVAARGQIEALGTAPHFKVKDAAGKTLAKTDLPKRDSPVGHDESFEYLVEWLRSHFAEKMQPIGVGHRVVHGGAEFIKPTLIDPRVMKGLEALIPLVPLHQPHNIAGIKAVTKIRPDLPQVACFDTAFHQGRANVTERFALPDELFRRGVRRWGFHGLSYEYVIASFKKIAPEVAGGRVIAAHLGSGASMCAIRNGKCVDTTMSFSVLDGLPMGTRCGALDPGVILHLLKDMTAREVESLLYKNSGLLGISGISNDVRELLASENPRTAAAIDYFVYRAIREIGSLVAALGGLDALIFTAGVGENSPIIRERICAGLAFLGITLDDQANQARKQRISRDVSRPSVWVIPTDEEAVIASHTLSVIQSKPPAAS